MSGKRRRRSRLKICNDLATDKLLEFDDAGSEESCEKALLVDLILKEIFGKLAVPDLLTCSLVSKLWCTHARSVLRDHKSCLARVRGKILCEVFKSFNELLQNSTDIPFSGLSIHLNNLRHVCVPTNDLSESYPAILDLKMREIYISWAENPPCPANELVKLIFHAKYSQLESLGFRFVPSVPTKIDETVFGSELHYDRQFSSLRVLEIPSTGQFSYPFERIINAAPKLSKIFGHVRPELLKYLAERHMISCVKGFVLEGADWNNETVKCFMNTGPKLETLKFTLPGPVTTSYLSPGGSVYQLLQCSENSLKELQVHQLDLFLMSISISAVPTFPCVTKLVLICDPNLEKKSRHLRLNNINYSRMFPNLLSVVLKGKKVLHTRELGLIRDTFQECPGKFVCNSVQHLDIKLDFCHDCPFPTLGQVFPNVRTLKVSHGHNMCLLCYSIWTAWSSLESIMFCDTIDFHLRDNQDPVFCGVFEDEALEWLSSKVDLSKLHYAPIRPCMSTLLKLKKFRLEILHTYRCHKYPINPETIFLSKLTGELVFSRMKGLDVEIVSRNCGDLCGFSMEHLRRFARVDLSMT